MKHLVLLFICLMFLKPVFSENPEKFSLNLKFSVPFVKSDIPQLNIFIDPGLEVLYYFPLNSGIKLGTGAGIQYGCHFWNQEVARLVWVDGKGWPTEYTNHYHFKFISLWVPISVDFPFQKSFIGSFTTGLNFCWYPLIDFSMERDMRQEDMEFNRLFIEPNAGLNIPLKKMNRVALSLHPQLSYRFYLTDRNDWQKNYLLAGIALNANI